MTKIRERGRKIYENKVGVFSHAAHVRVKSDF